MIFLILAFQLFNSPARAEVLKENFLIIGHHKKETLSLREHKVKTGTGFSIEKTYSDGKMTAHTLSSKEYSSLKQELEKFVKPIGLKQLREVTSCDDPIVIGIKQNQSDAKLSALCLDQEPVSKRKEFVRWWRKASKYL